MFFGGDDAAGFLGSGTDGVHVKGFYGVQIDDECLDAFFRKFLCCLHCLVDHGAVRNDCNVLALTAGACLAEFERCARIGDDGHTLTSEADVAGSLFRGNGEGCLARFLRVAGDDDGHVRQDAHDGDILKRLMCRAVGADGDARMGAGEFDVQVVVADGRADLVPCTPREEYAIRCGERKHAAEGEARRRADHVLFGDAYVEEVLWMFVPHPDGARGFCDVGIECDDIRILFDQFEEGFAIAVSHWDFFTHCAHLVSLPVPSPAARHWARFRASCSPPP